MVFVETKETRKFDLTKEVSLSEVARPEEKKAAPDYVNLDISYNEIKKRVTMKSQIEKIMSGAKSKEKTTKKQPPYIFLPPKEIINPVV